MIKLNGIVVTPTIFPDKTSQVWKLPEEIVAPSIAAIEWVFESEAEFMHLAQLRFLLGYGDRLKIANLYIDYLPYARQDKEIANDKTFALYPFLYLLNKLEFDSIQIFDAHNIDAVKKVLPYVQNIEPKAEILHTLDETKTTTVLFPDKGAYIRYAHLLEETELHVVIAEKTRDQLTGEIVNTRLTASIYKDDRILIVDDLCDGGATFIKLMPLIKRAAEVSLYVSHGIFSKGVQVLKDAGISRIFTKNGEVK